MTEKVRIDIKGVAAVDGEREAAKETAVGDYYRRNGKHYIIGSKKDGPIKRMKLTENSLTVVRGGGGGELVFERGKKTTAFYGTPGGGLTLEICTHRFAWHEEEELLEIKMEYSLYHGGTHVSDNYLEVRLSPERCE